MMDDKFFDVNIVVGKRAVCYPGSYYDRETIEKKMAQYGIARALVYHDAAREDDPGKGNRLTLEFTNQSDKFYPVFVTIPHHTRPEFAPCKFLEELRAHKVRAVKIFPGADAHNFMLHKVVSGELFEMLEANRIPLLIGHNQAGLNDIYGIAQEFQDLRMIVTDFTYRQDRNLYALMDKMENVYIETIGYKTFGGIEEFCRHFGAHRLLYGSGMPLYSGASAVSMIRYAEISEEEKEKIAYKNLDRLLSEVSYLQGGTGCRPY